MTKRSDSFASSFFNRISPYYSRNLEFLAARKMPYGLLVLFVLPIMLLLINDSWIFTDPSNTIDPWVYTGYFLDFSEHSRTFAGTYYGSRLGWILPGFLIHKMFPPLIANYSLHLMFFYSALISFYLILKWTINERPALFSSLLMGTYGHFLWSIGWDYVDGAGITYLLLTMTMLTYAGKCRNDKVVFFFAGLFFACMIHTNVFLIVFTPTLGIYYWVITRVEHKDPWHIGLFFSILGILAVTSLFGIISFGVNQSFLFFMPSLRFVAESVSRPNPWKTQGYSWIFNTYHLMLPILIFAGGIFAWLFGRMRPSRQKFGDAEAYASFFKGNFMIFFLGMVFLEFKGMPVLQLSYYASYLIPIMFLAFGSWFAVTFSGLEGSRYLLLILIVLLILMLVPIAHEVFSTSTFCIRLVFFIMGVLLVAFVILGSKKGWGIPICLLIVVAFGVFNLNFMRLELGVFLERKGARKSAFLAIVKSVQTIQELDKEVRNRLWFWYNGDEALGGVYRAVASTFLWGYRLINEKFPEVMDGRTYGGVEGIRRIRNVVILSRDEKAYEFARKALEKMGLSTNLALSRKINQGEMGFSMTFINIRGGSAYQMDGRRRIKQEDFTVFPVEDRYWSDTADFLVRSVKEGEKLFAPTEFGAKFPGRTYPYSSTGKEDAVFQWAVIHKGRLEEMDKELVKYVAKEFRPVFANEVFIVFSSRKDLPEVDRRSPHYQSFQKMFFP